MNEACSHRKKTMRGGVSLVPWRRESWAQGLVVDRGQMNRATYGSVRRADDVYLARRIVHAQYRRGENHLGEDTVGDGERGETELFEVIEEEAFRVVQRARAKVARGSAVLGRDEQLGAGGPAATEGNEGESAPDQMTASQCAMG